MLTLATPVSIPESVAFHALGEEDQSVLVSMETGYLFTCNQTTRAFLDAVDGRRTVGEIVDIVGQQFEVGREKLESDMLGIARQLISEGLLVTKDAKDS